MVENTKIGGVGLNEIAELVESQSSRVDPTEADTITRFSQSVAELLVLRRKQENKAFCAFILWKRSDKPPVDSLAPMPFVANGNDPISGDVWFVNHSLNHNSWKLSVSATDQQGFLATIERIGFLTSTIAIVDWRSGEPQAQVLIGGIRGQDSLKLYLEDEPISPSLLKETLDSIYEDNFRNPIVATSAEHGKVWTDAAKGWPAPKPEGVIQGQIRTALQRAFPRHTTKPETVTNDGRADLLICKRVKSQAGHPSTRTDWLLELKALRDKTPTGKPYTSPTPSDALSSGITQLLGYSAHLDPLARSLCCFDLRDPDVGDATCFACVESSAQNQNIHLWRWYFYRSTPAARDARYGSSLGKN